jgi:hypothetical protein
VLGNLRQGIASLLELMGESTRRGTVQPKA